MRNEISLFQYLLVCCSLIFTSSSSQISNNKVYLIIWCLISALYYMYSQIRAFQNIFIVVGVLCGVTIVYYFINNEIDEQTYVGFFVYIIGAFSTARILGRLLPEALVKVIYVASLISLPLYIFQLIAPSSLFEINNIFGLAHRNNSNSLIFNFTYLHASRNCGFMWEPGAFAGILIIGIYINVTVVDKLKIATLRNVVLFTALLTTLSTLGYITLLFPFIAIIIQRKQYKYLSLLLVMFPLIFGLDFLLPKLFKESNDLDDSLQKTQYATESSQVSVSRSASFVIDFSSFIERPILGYGLDFRTVSADKIFKDYDENVIRSSGIMNLLLRFGSVGLFVYMFLIFKSIRFYVGTKLAITFSILIFFVLFSNPIDNSPFLFILFYLWPGVPRHYTNDHILIPEKKFVKPPVKIDFHIGSKSY